MNDSLITAILLQAENPWAKPEDFPDLNASLKSNCYNRYFAYIIYFSGTLNGGLEDDYKNISRFITLNAQEVITHFDTDALLKHAQVLLAEANSNVDKKLAYKVGICLALVAVYADDVSIKKAAYEQLTLLFNEKGLLADPLSFEHCNRFLTPPAVDKKFNSTRVIIWAWEVSGKNMAATFESERQQLIQTEFANQPIKKALFLLGLSDFDLLNKDKIQAAYDGCNKRLQELCDVSFEEVATHPLLKSFNDAQNLLLYYQRFIGFNYKNRLKSLENLLHQVSNSEITQEGIFTSLYEAINEFDTELNEMLPIVKIEPPYITEETIAVHLGGYVGDSKQYKAQEKLHTVIGKFWEDICVKVVPLLIAANELLANHENISVRIGPLIEFATKAEKINGLITQIKELQLKRFKGISIANNAAQQWEELGSAMRQVKEQIDYYKAWVRINIRDLIHLNECLVLNEMARTKDTDALHLISEQSSLNKHIGGKLEWLRQLNGIAKIIVESELKNQTFGATNYESIESMRRNLEAHRTKLVLFKQQGSGKLNELLQQEICILLQQYKEAGKRLEQCSQERNSTSFSWEKKWSDFLKQQKTLDNVFTILNKKIPPDYDTAEYITQSTAKCILKLRQQKTGFEQKIAEVKKKIEESAIDTFHYLLLKERIEQEAKSFVTRDNEALTQFLQKIDQISSDDSGQRYASLVQLIKTEQNYLGQSREFNCLGLYCSSRSHAPFTPILHEFEKLVSVIGKKDWTDSSLSLDAMKYTLLKNQIEKESASYLEQGTHHQDRKESITRLQQQIAQLNQQEGSKGERFQALYECLKSEMVATTNSHLRIGFFPSWHLCRLQKVYGAILQNAENIRHLGSDAVEAPIFIAQMQGIDAL
ncbi:hypothetical protein J2N86_06245 [Legionella lytica]|uniref:Purine NTPase n=1 Tax=Legionella lytica TaxID=96232 RepID=A0ABY4YBS1_9GAMM|nr:hypothetical protein [Legionella lytica]USQ14897.1 hypothetical protein J2N86_06245 [Legionella lytica]